MAIAIHFADCGIDLDDCALQVTDEEPIIGGVKSTMVQFFLLAHELLRLLELVDARMHLLRYTAKARQQLPFC